MFGEMMARYEVEMQRDRHQEMLRTAQVEQILRQARSSEVQRLSLACQALLWLGRQLIAWGVDLQQRYSPSVNSSVPVGLLSKDFLRIETPKQDTILPNIEICLN